MKCKYYNDEISFIDFLKIYILLKKEIEFKFIKLIIFYIKYKLLNGDKTNNNIFLKIQKQLNLFKQNGSVRFKMIHFVDLIRPKRINNNSLTVYIANIYEYSFIETNRVINLFSELLIAFINDQRVDIIEYSKKIYT